MTRKIRVAMCRAKEARCVPVKYSEIIADNLTKQDLAWAGVSALDNAGRTVWIVDAHRDGKRFVVRADEKLTAFVELERAIYELAVDLIA